MNFSTEPKKDDGVCKIKPEYILANHVRSLAVEHISQEDKEKLTDKCDPVSEENIKVEEKEDVTHSESASITSAKDNSKRKKGQRVSKKKLKGQNHQRDVTYIPDQTRQFCHRCIDSLPENACSIPGCNQIHDLEKYLSIKDKNIGPECSVFRLRGHCPAGVTCRFSEDHVGESGKNIVNNEKMKASEADKSLQTLNILSKEVQKLLWKKKYDFLKSDVAISTVEQLGKRERNDKEVPNERSDSTTFGAIDDSDVIKLRPEEKKKIDWRGKSYLSPLTTVGNLPFRRICVEYGADITCGEMMLALPIVQGTREWVLARRHPSEKIFGVQICGKLPHLMARAAQVIEENTEVDFIDINMGCPIDALYQQGCGSGLMTRKNLARTVATSMVNVLNIPLTVKMRMGVSSGSPIAHELLPLFRSCGISLATVHGRSREQRYTKSADWAYIEKCARISSPMPIFGNGDILSYDDYNSFLEQSPSVAGAMIGRGALIKPWIFTEIKEKRTIDMPSSERLSMLQRYVNYGLDYWGSDTRGVETTRRFLLEWLSFLHRYVPAGVLASPPQRINQRPPAYSGRDEIETLMASSSCTDWIAISEMLLGKVPDGFHFLPKHKANAWK